MASVKQVIEVNRSADVVWTALGDFGAAASLFAGVLTDCERQGDERTVTFANGRQARERLISVDAAERRIVYSVISEPFTHHNASLQVEPAGAGCRVVWHSDFLPDVLAGEVVGPLSAAGAQALKRNLEAL